MPIIELKIIIETPLALDSGDGLHFSRDSRGRAVISATRLKGLHRIATETLARGLGLKVCNPPIAEQMCQPLEGQLPCPICRIFGSRWNAGIVRYRDLPSTLIPIIQEQSTAPQSRNRRQQLRVEKTRREVLIAGTTFSGQIDHLIAEPALLSLTLAGLRSITRLGSGNATGLGLCKVEATALDATKRPVDNAELATALRRLVGL